MSLLWWCRCRCNNVTVVVVVQVFVVSLMVALFFLPLVVLLLLYWRIARQLLLEDKQLCKDKPNPNLQARKQVTMEYGTIPESHNY